MKTETIHLIWNTINTCLVILLIVYVHVSVYIPKELESKVEKVEMELDTYKNMKSDSIVVKIDNQINFPKTIRIKVDQ